MMALAYKDLGNFNLAALDLSGLRTWTVFQYGIRGPALFRCTSSQEIVRAPAHIIESLEISNSCAAYPAPPSGAGSEVIYTINPGDEVFLISGLDTVFGVGTGLSQFKTVIIIALKSLGVAARLLSFSPQVIVLSPSSKGVVVVEQIVGEGVIQLMIVCKLVDDIAYLPQKMNVSNAWNYITQIYPASKISAFQSLADMWSSLGVSANDLRQTIVNKIAVYTGMEISVVE